MFVPKQRKYLVVFPEGGFLHKRKEVCTPNSFFNICSFGICQFMPQIMLPMQLLNFRQVTDLQLNWVSHQWSTALFPGFPSSLRHELIHCQHHTTLIIITNVNKVIVITNFSLTLPSSSSNTSSLIFLIELVLWMS